MNEETERIRKREETERKYVENVYERYKKILCGTTLLKLRHKNEGFVSFTFDTKLRTELWPMMRNLIMKKLSEKNLPTKVAITKTTERFIRITIMKI